MAAGTGCCVAAGCCVLGAPGGSGNSGGTVTWGGRGCAAGAACCVCVPVGDCCGCVAGGLTIWALAAVAAKKKPIATMARLMNSILVFANDGDEQVQDPREYEGAEDPNDDVVDAARLER